MAAVVRPAVPMTVAEVDRRLRALLDEMRLLVVERGVGMVEVDRLLDVRLAIVRGGGV